MKLKIFVLLAVIAAAICPVSGKDVFNCDFEKGRWNPADFIQVKSSRWPNINHFRQEAGHIVNACPANATKKDMLNKRVAETYAAMIYKNPLQGNVTVKSVMSFDYRMAPGIVIAEKPGVSTGNYPEFRTHYEVVLFDEGVNVWRHWFKDGKQVWRKMGYLKASFQPNKLYQLTVKLQFTSRGPVISVACGGHEFGFIDEQLSRDFYVGIVASEGFNRFYDFEIEK